MNEFTKRKTLKPVHHISVFWFWSYPSNSFSNTDLFPSTERKCVISWSLFLLLCVYLIVKMRITWHQKFFYYSLRTILCICIILCKLVEFCQKIIHLHLCKSLVFTIYKNDLNRCLGKFSLILITVETLYSGLNNYYYYLVVIMIWY